MYLGSGADGILGWSADACLYSFISFCLCPSNSAHAAASYISKESKDDDGIFMHFHSAARELWNGIRRPCSVQHVAAYAACGEKEERPSIGIKYPTLTSRRAEWDTASLDNSWVGDAFAPLFTL